eukprot:15436007-Alexandrium_andersonii.AAC.1
MCYSSSRAGAVRVSMQQDARKRGSRSPCGMRWAAHGSAYALLADAEDHAHISLRRLVQCAPVLHVPLPDAPPSTRASLRSPPHPACLPASCR